MMPIVDGLEQTYGDRLAFVRVDASTVSGREAFVASRLTGHPSYLILLPGESAGAWREAFRTVGPQAPETLDAAVQAALR